MFHDTRNQNISSVTNRIHFDFLTLKVLIYQNRVILSNLINDVHKFTNFIVIKCDLHTLSAENVGRTNQYRIAQTISHFNCFISGKYGSACSTWNLGLFQNLIKEFSVFRCIHILCIGS